MKKYFSIFNFIVIFGMVWTVFTQLPFYSGTQSVLAQGKSFGGETIKLPPPRYDGDVSVEKALLERRSIRSYRDEPLTLNELSQILWAAQGITEPKRGLRTAPSARALYLLEVYVLPGNVKDLPMGIYKYHPQGHELIRIAEGDKKAELYKAAGQATIKDAPVALLFAGLSEKSPVPTWMYLEAGHAAQNVYLQSVSLKLGTVVMGGFKEEDVKKVLNLPEKKQPLYIMPIGKK
jgi:SagB-type dehydrogenase family enzyme